MRCPIHHDLDPLGPSFTADPYPVLAAARETSPVFYVPAVDAYYVTRYQEIETVLRDPATFSASNALAPVHPLCEEAERILTEGGFGVVPTMVDLDPPEHRRIRNHSSKVFAELLSPKRSRDLAPVIRERASRLVDRFLPDGRADLVAQLTEPLPAQTIFMLLGFPSDDAELLKSWCDDRLRLNFGRLEPDAQVSAAQRLLQFWKYCERFVEVRMRDLRDDYTSALLRRHLDDPDGLRLREVTSMVFGLSLAGQETTNHFIASLLRHLLGTPAAWRELAADRALIANAVEEGLRHEPSIAAWRRVTTRPATIGGVPVPTGAQIVLHLGAAGRDPGQFPDPETFDIRPANAPAHLAFGKGIHFCLGASVARLQATIVLELLTARISDLALAGDAPIAYDPTLSFRGPRELWATWTPP